MTLDALALRVLMPSFAGTTAPRDLLRLLDGGLAGVCLFGANAHDGRTRVAELSQDIRSVAPEALIAVDEEGGDVTRLHVRKGSPALGALALGTADDLELTQAVGRAIGLDLADLGINLCLGPVADVNSRADNPVIGTRSFGATAPKVASHVAAWTTGLQSAGVAGCAKHFPGHGDTAEDSHLETPVLGVSAGMLAARDLAPFVAAIQAGVATVMTAHVVVSAIDRTVPATFSPSVLSVLRDQLGFRGAIVSDALDMAGASRTRGLPEAAVLAMVAGVDLLCLGPRADAAMVREVQLALVEAVRTGRLSENRLVIAASYIDGVAVRPTTGPSLDPLTLALAAAKSVTVSGTIPNLTGARSVRVDGDSPEVLQSSPWGLAADVVITPGQTALPEGPLVIQVRDAHRQPDVMTTLASARRDSVVVEWGWPAARAENAPATINARGWSQPGANAVANLLKSAGWER